MFKPITALVALAITLMPFGAVAQEAETETFEFEGLAFEGAPQSLTRGEYLGRPAILLNRSAVDVVGQDFGDGVIEFDVAAPHPSGFVGLYFRLTDNVHAEHFYVRFHQSGHPDATQYTPVLNGLAAWQIYTGPNEAVATTLPTENWLRVRLVVEGDRADIFVGDMETPLTHVPDLLANLESGGIAIYAADRPWVEESGVWFSNFTIRELEEGEGVIGMPAEEADLPDGLVTTWDVSSTFAETSLDGHADLGDFDRDALSWQELEVERNGIANIARLAAPGEDGNTVFARLMIPADEARAQALRFGYSDRVRIYLNGELLFKANAGWRARDHRFLGTINWEDQILLRLQPGENEVIFAVSESFGGWGVTAAFSDH